LTALAVAALLWGAARSWKGPRRAVALFAALDCGLIAVWLRPDPRYLVPLLFPAVLFFAEALSAAGGGKPRPWKKAAAGAAAALGLLAGSAAAKRRAFPRRRSNGCASACRPTR
jgi:hypothetical protein